MQALDFFCGNHLIPKNAVLQAKPLNNDLVSLKIKRPRFRGRLYNIV